jgi:hypothetical protein
MIVWTSHHPPYCEAGVVLAQKYWTIHQGGLG